MYRIEAFSVQTVFKHDCPGTDLNDTRDTWCERLAHGGVREIPVLDPDIHICPQFLYGGRARLVGPNFWSVITTLTWHTAM